MSRGQIHGDQGPHADDDQLHEEREDRPEQRGDHAADGATRLLDERDGDADAVAETQRDEQEDAEYG